MRLNGALSSADQLLLDVLREPTTVLTFQAREWDLLLRVARRARVLATIGEQLEQQALLEQLPLKAVEQLMGAQALVNQRQRMARWEINRLHRALADTRIPCILLKGGAYLLANLPVARGRLFADVDILVPKAYLETVETTLNQQGWEGVKFDPYNQRYYRRWMHELPPLRHRDRQVETDIHHTILPITSRLRPDPNLLLEAAQTIEGSAFKILAPVDMVLHSATHLFYDSDLSDQLRDLVDLDSLLRHFSRAASFWEELMPRATQLELRRPLFYALRYTQALLGTPVPFEFKSQRPMAPVRFLMDGLVPGALFPGHPDYPRWLTGVNRWLLYVRSHYLRMPMYLLMPHLVRKAVKRIQK